MIFRYPGGKTKMLPLLTELIYPLLNKSSDKSFYEPFVGGGSVVCKVAEDYPEHKLYINDKDDNIYAFWDLLCKSGTELNSLYSLLEVTPTLELFNHLRETLPTTNIEKAYYAIFFNRTTFSGISTSGPIGGQEQKSKWKINCRYNFKSMHTKIEKMRKLFNGRLFVSNLDVIEFMNSIPLDSVMYLDPPYYLQGKNLYFEFMKKDEHLTMAEELKKRTNWILSYDICEEIDLMYEWAEKIPLNARYSINGKKDNWINKKEYIITTKNIDLI